MVAIRFIRWLDAFVGSIICFLLGIFSLFSSRALSPHPRTILFIQLWGIGESILTLPTIKAVKKKYAVPLSVVCTQRNKDVFTGLSYIDSVVALSLNPWSLARFMFSNIRVFDVVIDFEEYLNFSSIIGFVVGKKRVGYSHGIRSWLYNRKVFYNDKQHVVETHMDLAAVLHVRHTASRLESLYVSSPDKLYVKRLLPSYPLKKKVICLAPGVAESAKSRMWASERWAKLADIFIKEYHASVMFVGTTEDQPLIVEIQHAMMHKAIDLSGKTTLKQLFYLVQRCTLFIGCDSGPIHIASAQGVTTIGLFCPNTPVRFGPYGKGNVAVYKPILETPCINVHRGEIPDCRKHKHMSRIMVEDVIEAVKKLCELSSLDFVGNHNHHIPNYNQAKNQPV